MPKLTEEDLAKIYPTPKTYDELQAERELLEEAARPKFVAAKIALWTSLFVPTTITAGYAALRIALSQEAVSSSMTVLASVCIVVLLVIIGLAALYYLWWLINALVSKTIVATSLFNVILFTILGVTGGLGVILCLYKLPLVVTALLTMGLVFVASFAATKLLIEKQR